MLFFKYSCLKFFENAMNMGEKDQTSRIKLEIYENKNDEK